MNVRIFPSNDIMGQAAAEEIAKAMKEVAEKKDTIRIMFAAAPSQNTTLQHLLEIPNLPWSKVSAFHMDEYVGISKEESQSFRNYLDVHIWDRVNSKEVNYIQGDSLDVNGEVSRYTELLKEDMDIIILGIGENGHIAFNDPPDACFDDPYDVKIVALSEKIPCATGS